MLYKTGSEWELSPFKVRYVEDGVEKEKYTHEPDWWTAFAEQWDYLKINEFIEMSYSAEAIHRFNEVKNMPDDIPEVYEQYILYGSTENEFPPSHPFQMIVLKDKAKQLKTASEVYDEEKDNQQTIEGLKNLRIGKLKEECSDTIYQGFSSGVNEFGYNEKDQGNFTKRMVTVVAGSLGPFEWKSKNNGVVSLTKDEFLQAVTDAEAHQLLHQKRYWNLESQILNAATAEEIHAILW